MERKIETYDSAEEFLKDLEEKRLAGIFNDRSILNIKNTEFNFKIEIPLSSKIGHLSTTLNKYFSSGKQIFSNCIFNEKVTINSSQKEIFFNNNCEFKKQLKVKSRHSNLIFHNSKINNLDVSESVFGKDANGLGKLRLKKCTVKNSNFKNATFYSLVDFYQTTFEESVIFNKTDFLNVLVLSAAKFKSNMLFTYTLLNDKVIMRGTKFFKGFDISLAIIKGELALFDITLDDKNFEVEKGEVSEENYEDFVANKGVIPIENKRETYRVLKYEYDKLKSIPESLYFKVLEQRTYRTILNKKANNIHERFDWLNLWLNDWSSIYGTSYLRAFLFTILIGLLFFNLSLISTDLFAFSFNPIEWEIAEGAKYFVQFLIPTHKFDYLGNKVDTGTAFYILDFVGRLLVGYGIYQFIQAFRKYK